MTEQYISSLSQYLSSIETLKSLYPTGMLLNNPIDSSFLYRGVCDSQYELLPGVFRKQTDKAGSHPIVNGKYLAWAKEKDLLFSFIQEASGVLSLSPVDIGHWAEYAQHYGVPTRFLDWSSNPLVALYFACRDNASCNGTVWLLHKTNYKRFFEKNLDNTGRRKINDIIVSLINEASNIEYPVLYTPYYVDSRMSAQGSFFMVWGSKIEPLEILLSADGLQMNLPNKADIGIHTYGATQQEGLLFRFHVYADKKQPILRELDTVGINEKTLFPGLDGIGRYIERKYRFDYNEAVNNF